MNVFVITIGSTSKKGTFQTYARKVIKSTSTQSELTRYFLKKYDPLEVKVELVMEHLIEEVTRPVSKPVTTVDTTPTPIKTVSNHIKINLGRENIEDSPDTKDLYAEWMGYQSKISDIQRKIYAKIVERYTKNSLVSSVRLDLLSLSGAEVFVFLKGELTTELKKSMENSNELPT